MNRQPPPLPLPAAITFILLLIGCGVSDDDLRESAAQLRTAALANNRQMVHYQMGKLAGEKDRSLDLLRPLLRDTDERVLRAATMVIDSIGTDPACDLLLRCALDSMGKEESDYNSLMTEQILYVGRRMGPAIVRAYDSKLPVQVRTDLIFLLGEIRDSTAIPFIEERLRETDYRIAEVAAIARGKIGDSRAFDRLSELLDTGAPNVKVGAVFGMRYRWNKRAVELLYEKILRRPDAKFDDWNTWTEEPTLHHMAASEIDYYTDRDFDGDMTKIARWIAGHPNGSDTVYVTARAPGADDVKER